MEKLKLSFQDKIHLMYLFDNRKEEILDPDFDFEIKSDSGWKLEGWDSFKRNISWTDGLGYYQATLTSGGDPRTDSAHVWEKNIPDEIKPYHGYVKPKNEKIFIVTVQPYQVFSYFEISAIDKEDVERKIKEAGGLDEMDIPSPEDADRNIVLVCIEEKIR